MKQSLYNIVVALSCMTVFSYSYAHRDGCTEVAQPCVCQNTNVKGFCFIGSNSQYPGEIYCNCQADTYSPKEFAQEWIKRFKQASSQKQAEILQRYPAIAQTIQGIVSFEKQSQQPPRPRTISMLNIQVPRIQLPANPIVPQIKIDDEYQKLIDYMRTPRMYLASEFFETDGCQFTGQQCPCIKSNGVRDLGICSMNYPNKDGKVWKKDVLYCHCD